MTEDYKPKGRKLLLVLFVLAVATLGANFYIKSGVEPLIEPVVEENEEEIEEPARPLSAKATTVASELSIPWEIVFLPSGEMLVTERSGSLVRVRGGVKEPIPIAGVRHSGEGGLLGVALHPAYESNGFIYLYFSTTNAGRAVNQVMRYVLRGSVFTEDKLILGNIPAAGNHNGGRIAFGPDGFLYVTTGDAGRSDWAQDKYSLAGKILRVTADGEIPEDNPFNNEVYSYGHRNPQGLAWDNLGRLWSTEHGRSGLQSGYDEINLIEKGGNYGWPDIEGDETREGMLRPILHSGPDTTWAPAGIVFLPATPARAGQTGHSGKLYWVGLRGSALYEAEVTPLGTLLSPKSYFAGEFGRLRAIIIGPGGALYLSTSNTDGRGNVREGDDRILKVGFE